MIRTTSTLRKSSSARGIAELIIARLTIAEKGCATADDNAQNIVANDFQSITIAFLINTMKRLIIDTKRSREQWLR